MDLHRPGDFSDDIDEMTSLEGRIRLGRLRVSVLDVSLCGRRQRKLTMASHCHTTTWSVALTASIWPGRCLSTLSAPYRPMMITLPGILSGLTTFISQYQTDILAVKNPDQLLRFHRRPHFDTTILSAKCRRSGGSSSHWIGDTPKVLDMSTIKLPSPISNPDEMRRNIVMLHTLWARCRCLSRTTRSNG
jgi:hypothetical protein